MTGPSRSQDAPNARFDQAALELTYFNFDVAYGLFTDLRGDAGPVGSEPWQRATLGLALAAQCKTPATSAALAEAQSLYQELIDETPGTAFAARATLNLGRIAEIRDYGGDQVDLDTARDYYQQVVEGWPDEAIADEAALRVADTYFQQFDDRAQVARGVQYLESWVADREDRPMAAVIWEIIAGVKQDQLQDHAGALAAFIKVDELGLAEPNVAGTLYYRAARLAQHEVGDLDTAIRFYRKIILEAPRSGRAFNAELALLALQQAHPDKGIEIPEIEMFSADEETEQPAGAQP